MKILFLSAANNIHTVRWANAMTIRHNEVFVVSCKNHKVQNNKFNEEVKVLYLKYRAGLGYYLNGRSLKKLIKEIAPDVINVHYASGYGTLARVAHIKKYLLNVWGSDVYDFPNKNFINKWILKKNLRAATLIASTSKSMAEETKKYTDKDIFITPFGVDLSLFKNNGVKRSDGKFVFCTVKTLAPVYGISEMIKAFSLFLRKVSESDCNSLGEIVEYHIYGKGPQQREIADLIEQLGLTSKVFLKGYIENRFVPKAINGCDVFLLKSERESFGVAAVEAMACSKPVIASNVSGFKEVMEDGVSGIIVDRNDLEKYATKMYELYCDSKKRIELGENARKSVEQLYDWDSNVSTMLDVYARLR